MSTTNIPQQSEPNERKQKIVAGRIIPFPENLRDDFQHLCDASRKRRRPLLTVKQYVEMGYEALHKELKRLVDHSKRDMVWLNKERAVQLLPALMAMQSMVAQPGRRNPTLGKPDWNEECRLLGITAAQVRQWKHRTAAEMDIRHLLGEDDQEPRTRQVPPSLELQKLQMLVRAVLENPDLGERLALQIAEEYGF